MLLNVYLSRPTTAQIDNIKLLDDKSGTLDFERSFVRTYDCTVTLYKDAG